MSIDIANEAGIEVDEVGLAAVARFTLEHMRIHPLAELSILLVDEQAMTDLHERWMGEPGPTDVLSFPMDELRPPHMDGGRTETAGPDPSLLGDVVLCPSVAAGQATKAGHSTQDRRNRRFLAVSDPAACNAAYDAARRPAETGLATLDGHLAHRVHGGETHHLLSPGFMLVVNICRFAGGATGERRRECGEENCRFHGFIPSTVNSRRRGGTGSRFLRASARDSARRVARP